VSWAAEDGGVAILRVPFDERTAKISREHLARGGVESERRDVLVVPVQDLLRLRGVVLVEEDNVATQRYRDQIVALPNAAELLIVHVVAEMERFLALQCLRVPDLAGLVGRGSENALRIRRP